MVAAAFRAVIGVPDITGLRRVREVLLVVDEARWDPRQILVDERSGRGGRAVGHAAEVGLFPLAAAAFGAIIGVPDFAVRGQIGDC